MRGLPEPGVHVLIRNREGECGIVTILKPEHAVELQRVLGMLVTHQHATAQSIAEFLANSPAVPSAAGRQLVHADAPALEVKELNSSSICGVPGKVKMTTCARVGSSFRF